MGHFQIPNDSTEPDDFSFFLSVPTGPEDFIDICP